MTELYYHLLVVVFGLDCCFVEAQNWWLMKLAVDYYPVDLSQKYLLHYYLAFPKQPEAYPTLS